MFRLNGKVAIVTGAGQGIGREIALSLAKNGAKVVVVDITDKISEVLGEIRASGGEGLAIKCDVMDGEEVEKTVRRAIEGFGRIDLLVNNAGIYPFKPFTEMTERDWDKVLNTNLNGAVLPKMIEQRGGKIINIASVAGSVVGFSNLVHHSSSKAGVVGFTRTLALEVAQYGINVNAVSPGPVSTPGTTSLDKETYEQIRRAIPLGRWGQPEDVANLVLFLSSEKSNFITGQHIIIDGGYTLQ